MMGRLILVRGETEQKQIARPSGGCFQDSERRLPHYGARNPGVRLQISSSHGSCAGGHLPPSGCALLLPAKPPKHLRARRPEPMLPDPLTTLPVEAVASPGRRRRRPHATVIERRNNSGSESFQIPTSAASSAPALTPFVLLSLSPGGGARAADAASAAASEGDSNDGLAGAATPLRLLYEGINARQDLRGQHLSSVSIHG